MRADLIVFDELPENREARELRAAGLAKLRERLDEALAIHSRHHLHPLSLEALRAEHEARVAIFAQRVNETIASQLAALFAPPSYLSPAEREFLEGSHAGRH
ncbi:hypothetical protein ASF58_23235 [Methylobacterium sp. Leaf125]|uniref:hypothetical protein n=1 Tax=Methylobacterium sp. Leaf125 TaxID=1736265 RepID=UPI0006FC09C1|nr:hypothetical protein [Methylobacterium sp. Leaf125]KQQ39057.1 hypothetical protein ASF58_23235 [Methylobacterium sp. Leaf125]